MVVYFFTGLKSPKLDRNWVEDSRVLPDITISTSTIRVDNIRDWSYKTGEVVSKRYYSDSFDLNQVTGAHFLESPFGKWKGIAHTFFIFEFADGRNVSVSVEARKTVGSEYSPIKGIFHNYEVWYAWGSAGDFTTRRSVYWGDPLYKYPLLISTTTASQILADLARATEKLETEPQFYNTVLSNCTNLLADSANRVHPGSISWSYARIFAGFADEELYRLELIPHDKPFGEVQREHKI